MFPVALDGTIRLGSGPLLEGEDLKKLQRETIPLLSDCQDDAVRSVLFGFFEPHATNDDLQILASALDHEPPGMARHILEHVLCVWAKNGRAGLVQSSLLRNIKILTDIGIKTLIQIANKKTSFRKPLADSLRAKQIDPSAILGIATFHPRLYYKLAEMCKESGPFPLPKQPEDLVQALAESKFTSSSNEAEDRKVLERIVYSQE